MTLRCQVGVAVVNGCDWLSLSDLALTPVFPRSEDCHTRAEEGVEQGLYTRCLFYWFHTIDPLVAFKATKS